MSDGNFDAPRAPIVERTGSEPNPGDRVAIVAGRYRGSTGILNAVVTTATPSGANIVVAYVKRPRSGMIIVFSHEIERV